MGWEEGTDPFSLSLSLSLTTSFSFSFSFSLHPCMGLARGLLGACMGLARGLLTSFLSIEITEEWTLFSLFRDPYWNSTNLVINHFSPLRTVTLSPNMSE